MSNEQFVKILEREIKILQDDIESEPPEMVSPFKILNHEFAISVLRKIIDFISSDNTQPSSDI
jgi:hypothetical protein